MKIGLILAGGYRLLVGEYKQGIMGGAEVQMTRLARHLSRQGHDVSYICGDPGHAREQTVNGIHILPAFKRYGGIPVVRFFQMKRGIENAMARADADAYVQYCASPITGIAAAWARGHGRKFVYMAASDPDVDGRYEAAVGLRDRWFYSRGLRMASGIVAQTDWQAERVAARLNRHAVVLPSALEIPAEAPPPPAPDFVFWAGSFRRCKRPHLLLEVARRAPELKFYIAGSVSGEREYGEQFVADLKKFPNIEYRGEVRYEEMPALYEHAVALFNTSEYEGFSNTYLEAWRAGVPIVSLGVDPDNLIRRHELGAVSADFDTVVAELRALKSDTARRIRIASAGRRLVEQNSAPVVAERLTRYLGALVAGADERAAALAAATPLPAPPTASTATEAPRHPLPAATRPGSADMAGAEGRAGRADH